MGIVIHMRDIIMDGEAIILQSILGDGKRVEIIRDRNKLRVSKLIWKYM
jgi:hypothetical protein